jgi:hypothetical protein
MWEVSAQEMDSKVEGTKLIQIAEKWQSMPALARSTKKNKSKGKRMNLLVFTEA